MKGHSFLLGYAVFSTDTEYIEAIINLCNENAIVYSNIKICENETTLCVSLFCLNRFKKATAAQGIPSTLISLKGLPSLLWRHRKRAGLLVGLIISVVLFTLSSQLIWDIRIDGAITVSEREILDTLEQCGLYVGTKIKDIDSDVLENHALILSDKISWISINLSGNVANVEIRELDYALPDENGELLYSNVVASQDGIIVGFENVSGSISASIGDAVSKGQLLISGIAGGEGAPTRLMRAKGKVFAEVEQTVEIKIPQKYIKKVTKDNVKEEKFLIFFKNEIKFFANSRNSTSSCDKIEVIENLYTRNGKKLPLATKTVKYIEYEEAEYSRTQNEMRELAMRELYRYIDEQMNDAEILSRTTSFEELDDALLLKCKIQCVKNIAEQKEIKIG